jgi:hypothetical protein
MKNSYYLFTIKHLARNQLLLAMVFLLPLCLPAQKVDLLTSDGTSSKFSAPQDGLRQQRQFYLITPSEMANTDLSGGATINELGFTLGVAPTKGNEADETFNFPGSNFESNGTSFSTVSTLNYAGLPAGAEIISANLILTNINAISPSWRSEFKFSLSGDFTLPETGVSNADSPGNISSFTVALSNFPITAGTINLRFRETLNDASINPDATVASARIEINYKVDGLLKIYMGNTDDTERQINLDWSAPITTANLSSGTINIDPGPYEWRVKATVGGMETPYSDTTFFNSSNPADCNPATNLEVTTIGNTTATVSWDAPVSNGFANYLVEYKELGTETFTALPVITNAATKTASISGLTVGTSYQWQVTTQCAGDDAVAVGSIFTTNDNGCGNTQLSSLSATTTNTTAELSWSLDGTNSYEIQYRRTGTQNWITTQSPTNSKTLEGLASGTSYEWRVRTTCLDLNESPPEQRKGPWPAANGSFSTTGSAPLFAPTGLQTNEISPTQVSFSWEPVSGATMYTVEYRTKESVSWTEVQAEGLTEVFNDYFEIPASVGPYSIPLSTPLAYQSGKGLYIAWEYQRVDGDLAPENTALTTQSGVKIVEDPMNTGSVTTSFFSFGAQTDASTTTPKELLPASFFRPATHVIASGLVDVAEVAAIYALGHHPIGYANPSTVSVLVKNNSGSNGSFPVTLNVVDENGTTVETFSKTESVNANSQKLVTFSDWLPVQSGIYSLDVEISAQTGETVLSNNKMSNAQVVSSSILSYADILPTFTSAGFGTGSGLILARHTMDGCGKINAAQIYLTFSARSKPVYAVVLDKDGNILDQSATFTPTDSEVNDYYNFYFPNTPSITTGEAFYIGLAQTANGDYNPVGVQWETEDIRSSAYYRANLDGSGLTETPEPGRLMIRAEIIPVGSVPVIEGETTLCAANTSNTLTVVAESQRFANAVVSHTRGGNAVDLEQSEYSTYQLLGTPNVFPDYGNSGNNFQSNQESNFMNEAVEEAITLELSGGSGSINYVDVFETYREGDEVTISVFAVSNSIPVQLPIISAPAAGFERARKIRFTSAAPITGVSRIIIILSNPNSTSKIGLDAITAGLTPSSSFSDYTWSFNGTPNGETTASITASAMGIYSVVTDMGVCDQIASVEITDPVKPIIRVANSETDLEMQNIVVDNQMATFCAGSSLTLISSEPINNTWSSGETTESIALTDASQSGMYTVTYNDGACEAESDPFTVVINALPEVDISGAAGICPSGSTTLSAFINDGNTYTYLWSDNSANPDITVSTEGNFTVTVTSTNGCSATDGVTTFFVTPPNAVISGDITICDGDASTLSANPTGNFTYFWTPGGETTSTISVNTATNIGLIVTDEYGCSGSTLVTTQILDAPTPEIVGNASFCEGIPTNTVLTTSEEYDTYLWSTGETSSFINVLIDAASSYSVTVTDDEGCTGETTINIVESGEVPETPGPISGTTSGICGATGLVYSVPPVDNADYYVWTLPEGMVILSGQGTTSITADASMGFTPGIIEVIAVNDCGASPTVGLTFPVAQPNPAMPGTPSGTSTGVIPGFPYTYSIAPVAGADSYTWSMPSGATIIGGQGTTSVTVVFSAIFSIGDICVDAVNQCGVSFCCLGNCLTVEAGNLLSDEPGLTVDEELEEEYSEPEAESFQIEQPEVLELGVYPNPNNGQFTLEGSLVSTGNLELRVFSLLGELVYYQDMGYQEDIYLNQEIQVPNLSAGTYIVQAIIGDTQWNTKMVIVNY